MSLYVPEVQCQIFCKFQKSCAREACKSPALNACFTAIHTATRHGSCTMIPHPLLPRSEMDTKILVYSDLHLEFSDFAPSSAEFDVVVLAGDIGVGTQGVEWAIRNFEDKPVVYICGNHEFYGLDLHGVMRESRELAAGSNVHFLENESVCCFLTIIRKISDGLDCFFLFLMSKPFLRLQQLYSKSA